MSDARGQVHVWTGGGAAADWSDPANWKDASVPQSPAAAVVFEPRFDGRRVSRQHVADPFEAGGLLFNVSDTYFEVTGNPIRLRDFGGIFDDSPARGTRIVRAPLQLNGRLEVEAMPGTISSPGLNLLDVSGPGSLSVRRGLVRLGRATYTGTTTVSNGEL